MPNHVTNILTIKGTEAQVREVRAAVETRGIPEEDWDGKPTGKAFDLFIDFNRLIPMAPELRETHSDGLVAYLENQFTMVSPTSDLAKEIVRSSPEGIENFCSAVRNLHKHGHACWYGWAVAKWGTKWNGYDQAEVEPNILSFDTAWSHPAPIFAALSQRFPGVVFEIKYADEDIGRNVGHFLIQDGVKTALERFEPGSKRAQEFAYAVKGWDPKDLEEEE